MAEVELGPPHPTKEECAYAACYCEENVYRLIQRPCFDACGDDAFAVFISNKDKKVPFWCQRSSSQDGGLVIWDYHVIMVTWWRDQCLIYDFDTTLPFPCPAIEYVSAALRPEVNLKKDFRRFFRIVPRSKLVQTFASDRSHMLKKGKWLAPPPLPPPTRTEASTMNLFSFLDMSTGDSVVPGEVMREDAFHEWLRGARPGQAVA